MASLVGYVVALMFMFAATLVILAFSIELWLDVIVRIKNELRSKRD